MCISAFTVESSGETTTFETTTLVNETTAGIIRNFCLRVNLISSIAYIVKVVEDIAIGTRDSWFVSRAGQIAQSVRS